jgi:spore maturation protein CgeB
VKILYVGPLDSWGACISRLRALQQSDETVLTYDTGFVGREGNKLFRYIESRTGVGETYLRANRGLLERAASTRPDVVWVDKGFWIWPSTLKKLRSGGLFLMQHNSDDIYALHARWQYRLLRQGFQFYNVNFVTNESNFAEMVGRGFSGVHLIEHAYDHERFFKKELSPVEMGRWSAPVVFAGHWEPKTEEYLSALDAAGIAVKIYGWGWAKARNKALAKNAVDTYLIGEDYVNCLRGARICLGFLSKWNRNLSTMRIYEIPACGAFLLAERTEKTAMAFVEGEEAEFFSGPDELVAKTRHYLDDEAERSRIASRGYLRCRESKYSWRDRVGEMLAVIREEISRARSGQIHAR